MKKRTISSLLAGLMAPWLGGGCGLDEYRAALPSSEQVTIRVPSAGGHAATTNASGFGLKSSALLGETADFYLMTFDVSTRLNGDAMSLLTLVHNVTEQPFTSQTANSRTWGPFTPGGLDPLTYRLLVSRPVAGQYAFALEARPRASTAESDFLAILDGTTNPGVGAGTGKGNMTVHFDHVRKLRPDACEMGSVAFVFDNTQPAAKLGVAFHQVGNSNAANPACKTDPPADAVYDYERGSDGAGNFRFNVRTNIHKPSENKPLLEDVSIRSRWLASGAGRSDVTISGGEVTPDLKSQGFAASAVNASQCWGTEFKTVFETCDPAAVKAVPLDGKESACVFTSAQLP